MTAPLCEMLRNSAEFWKGGIRELAGQGTIAHQVSLSQAAPGSTQAALRAQARALRFRQTPTCPLISYRWPSMLNLGGAKTGSKLVKKEKICFLSSIAVFNQILLEDTSFDAYLLVFGTLHIA